MTPEAREKQKRLYWQWLASDDGRKWLSSPDGEKWLSSGSGGEYLNTPGGRGVAAIAGRDEVQGKSCKQDFQGCCKLTVSDMENMKGFSYGRNRCCNIGNQDESGRREEAA